MTFRTSKTAFILKKLIIKQCVPIEPITFISYTHFSWAFIVTISAQVST